MVDPASEIDGLDHEGASDARARVKSELDPGERLLWSGRPLKRVEIPRFAVGLMGGLGAVALLLGLALNPALLIACLVFWLLLAVILLQHRQNTLRRAGTLYALTDRRAIIWMPETGRKGAMRVHSVARGEVSSVYRVELPDGSGDVVFRLRGIEITDGIPATRPGFEGIGDVRKVEEQVRRTLFAGVDRGSDPVV